jgi:hypothetical protein
MGQKRFLVCGAILVAAGIGAPTTAFLGSGGALSEPRTPAVEDTAPVVPPEPAEIPAEIPVGTTVTTAPEPVASSSPRRVGAGTVVPPHTGVEPPPGPRTQQTQDSAAPAGPGPAPSPEATSPTVQPTDVQPAPPPQREPPTFVPVEPDPADDTDGAGPGAPPALPTDDVDPADQ